MGTKLIKFTQTNGEEVAINPKYVIRVERCDQDGSKVHLEGGTARLRDPFDEVVGKVRTG